MSNRALFMQSGVIVTEECEDAVKCEEIEKCRLFVRHFPYSITIIYKSSR